MKITFNCKATHPFVAVNTLVLKTSNGLRLVIDREETDFTVVSNKADGHYIIMTWEDCYIHSINNCCVFDDGAMITNTREFSNLIKGCQSEFFEIDDDLVAEKRTDENYYKIKILDYMLED